MKRGFVDLHNKPKEDTNALMEKLDELYPELKWAAGEKPSEWKPSVWGNLVARPPGPQEQGTIYLVNISSPLRPQGYKELAMEEFFHHIKITYKIRLDEIEDEQGYAAVFTGNDREAIKIFLKRLEEAHPTLRWGAGEKPSKWLPTREVGYLCVCRNPAYNDGRPVLSYLVEGDTPTNPCRIIDTDGFIDYIRIAYRTALGYEAESGKQAGPHRCPICGGTGVMGFMEFYHDDPKGCRGPQGG